MHSPVTFLLCAKQGCAWIQLLVLGYLSKKGPMGVYVYETEREN